MLKFPARDGFRSFSMGNIIRIYKLTTFIENKFEAYLDNDDSPDISNPIHSTLKSTVKMMVQVLPDFGY